MNSIAPEPLAAPPKQTSPRCPVATTRPAWKATSSKRLARETTRALSDYNMIEAGDKVMVCLSGGKDSYALLDILLQLKKRAPFPSR